MKLTKLLTVSALSVLAMTAAHADTMDAREADETATKVRQVSYQCSTGGAVKVTYGFNRQNLPTYAQAHLGGKTRFLPINLKHSDVAGTFFGDENSWQIGSSAITLRNYHRSDVLIQDPDVVTAYKNCRVTGVKRIKG